MSSFTSSSEIRHKFESTSATNPKRKSYDVYLSFCDEDATSFAKDLYEALSRKAGVVVFWDNERIGSGDREIPTSVLNVIRDCKLVVIVFSTKYVNSSWCLQELEKITEHCRTTDGFMVLPVFYDGVHLSFGILERDVFGEEAFHDFLDRISMEEETSKEEDKFMTWVATISKATAYSGESSDLEHGKNSIHIYDVVVECATCVLRNWRDFYAFYPVSVKAGVQDVIHILKQSKSPILLGIWGMAGIGKSTIAQAIYHQIGTYFEHKCLLKKVREVWKNYHRQVSLQEKLLFYMDKATEIDIPTIESGKLILKERLQHKRVLLLLDDVNNLEQLEALCGNPDWFGAGSKIIITARDRHLLKEHGVSHIYKVKELNESESLEVLNRGAFNQATSREDFAEISTQVVAYSRGLPLALGVLGWFLNGKEMREWKGVLKSLERFSIPSPRLLEALENSFSYLSDKEKRIFLDIAFFFNGMDQNDVLQTLNRSTQSAALQISLLEDKSLITIDENNKLEMHVLLQAMARDIIKRESSNKTYQTADVAQDSFLLPCDNKSDWLTFSSKGCSITFDVPTMKGNNMKSMILFVAYYSSPENITSEGCQGVLIINYAKTTILAYKKDTLSSFEDEVWKSIQSNLEPGNEVEVIVVFGEGFIVEKTAISLLYDESMNKEMEHCNAVDEDVIVSCHDDANASVSDGDNIDLPVENNVNSLVQDENISEDKHLHAMNKNSGDVVMATNKKYACCFWWR